MKDFYHNEGAARDVRVPFFARFSGRDTDVLKKCPVDEIRVSANLGRVRAVAALLHGGGMLATLSIVGVELPIGGVVAVTTACGLAAVDGIIIAAHDRADAEAGIRRIEGTDSPKLTGWFPRLSATSVRIIFSGIIGLLFGGAITAHVFEYDVATELGLQQAAIDAPFLAESLDLLSTERTALEVKLQQAQDTSADLADATDAAEVLAKATLAALEANVEQHRTQADFYLRELRSSQDTAVVQRDLALCEATGDGPNCAAASGKKGEGLRWKLAVARADAAEKRANDLQRNLQQEDKLFTAAQSRLFEARRDVRPVAIGQGNQIDAQAQEAADDLAEFDATVTERAKAMVVANPLRHELDTRSLSTRIAVLHQLALTSPGFFPAMLIIKAAAMGFELMTLLAAMMLRRGEYSLHRGRKLASTARTLRNLHLQEFAEDRRLRSEFQSARRSQVNDAFADDWVAKAMKSSRGTAGESANRP